MAEWRELIEVTGGRPFVVERVRLADSDIAVEGEFVPPPLAALPAEDQVFVAAFVRAHGSIKEMERLFGISYPTVKGRLNRIGAALGFPEVIAEPGPEEVLDRLEAGEISAAQAADELERR